MYGHHLTEVCDMSCLRKY